MENGLVQIREARSGDAVAVARLLGQLGYPTDAATARSRIDRYAGDPNARLLVAEADGKLAGLVSFAVFPLLEHDGSTCRLTALVVDEERRGQGVGEALVGAVEAEAKRRGCGWLEVMSSERRADAHRFYERLGFEEFRKRFLRTLPGHPPKRR